MAGTTIEKIRIPWERFESIMEEKFELVRKIGATEEQLEEVRKTMLERYENGDFDISLDVIFGSDK